MDDAKVITYIKEKVNQSTFESISAELNVEFLEVANTQRLCRMISNNNYHTDLIIIDIKQLCSFSGTELLDVILMLRTLIKCSCPTKLHKIETIPVGVSVNLSTDPKLIRQVISTGYITGIYPGSDDFTLEEKILAVGSLLKNEMHVPQKIHKILNEKKSQKKVKSNSNEIKLTPRQQQILNLIVGRGASNKLIARMLNISESTVKLHMTQILKKHGLTNRTQLALFSKSDESILT